VENISRYGIRQLSRGCPLVDGRDVSFMTCHACPWKGEKHFNELKKSISLKVYTKEIYESAYYACLFNFRDKEKL